MATLPTRNVTALSALPALVVSGSTRRRGFWRRLDLLQPFLVILASAVSWRIFMPEKVYERYMD